MHTQGRMTLAYLPTALWRVIISFLNVCDAYGDRTISLSHINKERKFGLWRVSIYMCHLLEQTMRRWSHRVQFDLTIGKGRYYLWTLNPNNKQVTRFVRMNIQKQLSVPHDWFDLLAKHVCIVPSDVFRPRRRRMQWRVRRLLEAGAKKMQHHPPLSIEDNQPK